MEGQTAHFPRLSDIEYGEKCSLPVPWGEEDPGGKTLEVSIFLEEAEKIL